MRLDVIQPGLAMVVQGTPYRGIRHRGMPLAGAADPVAFALANWLAGNAPEAPALEFAYAPVTLIARGSVIVAIQGAAIEVEIDEQKRGTDKAIRLSDGNELRIDAPSGGCRSYLAVRGEIRVDPVLGAKSTYLAAKMGGLSGAALQVGDHVGAGIAHDMTLAELPAAFRIRHGLDFMLRVTDAQESDWIATDDLIGQQWIIGRRGDRMGLELEGPAITPMHNNQLESSAVFPGTIQCPPSGLPFLLGPDAQTTGGYPRIAQVIRADRHLIGQLRPGARVRFQRIEPAEAQSLYRSKIALIRQLQPGFRLD